ncbi:MAG: bifunctional DNA primase/polymerase [Actinomycetota bacterium]|nr:bifunctional DNA primase/polymerase [Actinomycetota bacterium]
MTTPAPLENGTGAVELNVPGGHAQLTATDRPNLAEHAAAYARAGLAVLPLHTPVSGRGCSCTHPGCRSVGKHPRTRNGKDDATTNLRKIAALWTCWPDANIGLRPAEGVVVLDVDPRAGGATSLAALLDVPGRELPATLSANTGGGGLHIWFRCPGPYRGQLAPGVDLKGSAGYLVAPSSVHASGRRYSWAAALQVAPAPAWLRPLIRRPACAPAPRYLVPTGGSADDGLVRTVATAAEGGRNAALHWAACRAAERGAPAELLDRLRDAARSVGLDDREIERTIRSALQSRRGAA